MFKLNDLLLNPITIKSNFLNFDGISDSNSLIKLKKDLLVSEKLKKNKLFSTFYKPKKINFEKKVYSKEERIKLIDFLQKKKKKKVNFFKPKIKSLKKFTFSKFKIKFWKKDITALKPLKKIQTSIFLKKLVIGFSKFPKFFWKSLLITMSEIKMRAILDYYDYFGLITTARNYICVHSDLNINKSLVKLKPLQVKGFKISVFAKKILKKMLWKKIKSKKFFRKTFKFIPFRFLPFKTLESKMFKNFYRPFVTKQFEKTDQLQRSFFLDKYLIYWKLLPKATKDFFGYISKMNKGEKYLYNNTHQISSIFFWNFIKFFWKKRKRILNFKKYKTKLLLKKFLFSYFNMSVNKLVSNKLNKWTDTQFLQPFTFLNSFFKKIFENKFKWVNFSLTGNEKSVTSPVILFRRIFGLFWSTAKKFIRKSKIYNLYSKIDYFTKAKYVRKDLVIDSFSSEIWKDFKNLAKKLNYNNLNFNFKKMLRIILPKQKLIEYNLLRSNNLYNFVNVSTVNRKFFSILKIFWKDWGKNEAPLSSYKLTFPINFDVDKYLFYENLTIFIREIGLTQTYFTPAYELPFNYYKENFYDNKKKKGFEFFFSTRLILAATTIWFPVLLNSWLFGDTYCIVFIPRPDSLTISEIKNQAKNLENFNNKTYSVKLSNYIKKLNTDVSNIWNLILKFVVKNKFKNNVFLNLFNLLKTNFFKNNLSCISSSFFFLFFLNYAHFKSLKKKSFFSPITFGYQMIQFFTASIKFETFIKFNKSNTYAAFAQTSWIQQRNPLTFFRINGYKKNKTNGEVTAIAFNFNTLAPGIYYGLTHDWVNPAFLSADVRRENTHKVVKATFTSELEYYTSKLPFTLMFYDNLKEQLTTFNKSFGTLNFKNSTAMSIYKSLIFDMIPYSLLRHASFKYWYDYLTIFENRSLNFLTSKTRRTSRLVNYFIGPIGITLFLQNNLLLYSKSGSIFKYLTTLTTFSILEAQALRFPELIFQLQFDNKKLNLSWTYQLLDSYYDQSFFHFLKSDILSSYDDFNFLEMHCLTAISNNFCLNSIRFKETEKFQFSFLDGNNKFDYYLPTTMLNDNFVEYYKLRWYFYGFPDVVGKSPFIFKNFKFLLNLTMHLSRFLVFSEQTFFFISHINMENISLQSFNYNSYLSSKLTPTFFFKNEFSKINYYRFIEDSNQLSNIHSIKDKMSQYQQSNLYFFPSMQKGTTVFNYNSKASVSANQPFFSKVLNYHYSIDSKSFFLKNIWKINFFFNEVFFYNKSLITSIILEEFKFKSKFKTVKSTTDRSGFAKTFLLAKSLFNLYFSKYNIYINYKRNFFLIKIKKILILLWLIINSTFFSKFSINFVFFIFYYVFFILKKNIIKIKKTNNSVLSNLFVSFQNYSFLNKSKFSLITLIPNNFYKIVNLLPLFLKDIAKKKIHNKKNLSKIEELYELKSFFILKKKKFNYEKSLVFFFFFFFKTFFFNSIKKTFFLVMDSMYKINNYFYFFEIQLLKTLSKSFFLNINQLTITTNKSFFLQSTTQNFTSLINHYNGSFDPHILNDKLNLLILHFQKWKILKNYSFFWYSYVNYFNNSLKYFLSYISNNSYNRKIKVKNKVQSVILNYQYQGKVADLYKINNFMYLKWIAKNSFKLNRFTFFKKLIDIFAEIKTTEVLKDYMFLNRKLKKNTQGIINMTFYKLNVTKKSNNETLSKFTHSKIRSSVRGFINFISLTKKISLEEKILNAKVFNLQLYHSYVSCGKSDISINPTNFNFDSLILLILIKNFYSLKKNKLFFSGQDNFYINTLHSIRNFWKIIRNSDSTNFLLQASFVKKKTSLESRINKKTSYDLNNLIFLLQSLPRFQILFNFLNLNKNYTSTTYGLGLFITNIFFFLSLNAFKELSFIKNDKELFSLKLLLGIFIFLKKNILLNLSQNKKIFMLKHKNLYLPSTLNFQVWKNSYFYFLHFNIKSLAFLNYDYKNSKDFKNKLYLPKGFNLIGDLTHNNKKLDDYNYKQLLKLNHNLIYSSFYIDLKQSFLKNFFILGFLFFYFLVFNKFEI